MQFNMCQNNLVLIHSFIHCVVWLWKVDCGQDLNNWSLNKTIIQTLYFFNFKVYILYYNTSHFPSVASLESQNDNFPLASAAFSSSEIQEDGCVFFLFFFFLKSCSRLSLEEL